MKFRILDIDGGNEETINVDSLQEAIEWATDWAESGDYDERVTVRVRIKEFDDDIDLKTIEIEAGPLPQPPETDCGTEDEDLTFDLPGSLPAM